MPRGSLVAILGINGAGKTTTLRAISGFIGLDDAEVTEGDIRYKGERIANEPPHRVTARGIVLVPERSKVFENLSVAENLQAAGRASAAERRRLAEQSTNSSPPRHAARARSGLLSGGERQMLAIGTALMCAPELLLVDEPLAGARPAARRAADAAPAGDSRELGMTLCSSSRTPAWRWKSRTTAT